MSDSSAKKKLKQTRLPFAIIISDSEKFTVSKDGENTSTSRKRKPSSDAENVKSNKIGRVAESKENVASKEEEEADDIEIIDVDKEQPTNDCKPFEPFEMEEASMKPPEGIEKTPTSSAPDYTLHIKLPSSTKSKRKLQTKPPNSVDEEDPDDSVVYLDNEQIRETKKTKKNVKRRKQKESPNDEQSRARKSLNISESVEEVIKSEDERNILQPNESKDMSDDKARKDKHETNPDAVIPHCKGGEPDKGEPSKENKASPEECVITSIPSNQSSPEAEDPDAIHDEIIEMLSDDSDLNNKTLPEGDGGIGRTPTSGKVDNKNLTPKQLARRQDQENRRLEKELQRQKERDLKEQQRLKEKEAREEAKRKEKDEKEEARKREKEDRDRKRQVC